jgi:DNA-binding PadR family transcriptional regulator
MNLLSRTEEILLLAVWRLQDQAYGISIRNEASRSTGSNWSLGAVYAPLHRLEKKGFVRTRAGDPAPERGGRAKVYYQLTSTGRRALLDVKRVQETLWTGIQSLERARIS